MQSFSFVFSSQNIVVLLHHIKQHCQQLNYYCCARLFLHKPESLTQSLKDRYWWFLFKFIQLHYVGWNNSSQVE